MRQTFDEHSSRSKFPPAAQRTGETAFTLVEVLVAIAIIALLIGILLPVISRARATSRSVTCLTNLRQITTAFALSAQQHGGKLPDPSVTMVSWEGSLKVYLNGRVFCCPADEELFPQVGSSYDWRDTGDPLTTLAGKDISLAPRSDVVLAFDALPGWHGPQRINVAFLDGSARTMDQAECFADLDTPVLSTQRAMAVVRRKH